MNQTQTLRRPAAAIAILLLCLAVSACSGGQGPRTQTTAGMHAATAASSKLGGNTTAAAESSEEDPSKPPISDGDNSSDARPGPTDKRRDSDDGPIVAFGHPASASESALIAALVRRYYAAAVTEDGAKGCSMLYSIYAESIAEDYGSPSGPSWSQGESCATVLTKTFQHFHKELALRYHRLHVAQVRVKDRYGVALLRFPGLLERELDLERESGTWRIFSLIDKLLP